MENNGTQTKQSYRYRIRGAFAGRSSLILQQHAPRCTYGKVGRLPVASATTSEVRIANLVPGLGTVPTDLSRSGARERGVRKSTDIKDPPADRSSRSVLWNERASIPGPSSDARWQGRPSMAWPALSSGLAGGDDTACISLSSGHPTPSLPQRGFGPDETDPAPCSTKLAAGCVIALRGSGQGRSSTTAVARARASSFRLQFSHCFSLLAPRGRVEATAITDAQEVRGQATDTVRA
ncbi:uncharacterized protein PSFLO_02048 [Pseudozyma flocculosa]|uniref:Uncharacterized protein n=1 Tax=Pseudozyma flocculosa TaxID=84751 RepID=A0A5C3EYT1_9BASI|nr:uncharacterized protein PSFLO_02048 [Pseudozyma flocculosa]